MKILMTHNYYRQPGGEDTVFDAERKLLLGAGHNLITYMRHNDEIAHYSPVRKASLPIKTLWAQDSCREIEQLIRKERPDVAHFHNTFPLISPGPYYSCQRLGVPVVQTLHNYRLLCPAATLFRDSHVCQECIDHSLLRSVRYGCYRASRPATATVAAMLAYHRMRDTWREMVDCFITPTEFSRKKFLDAGVPAEKVMTKPNFLNQDPGVRRESEDYALFLGRLSPEKGLKTLLSAWRKLSDPPALKILGDGPLRADLERIVSENGSCNVHFHGPMPHELAIRAIKGARALVFPSESYETFGLVAVEAFACGVPVIASRLGAMAEIVDDGRTGLHFTAGDADDLAAKVEWAWNHPEEMARMGCAARAEYEAKYTAERNYAKLLEIYAGVQR